MEKSNNNDDISIYLCWGNKNLDSVLGCGNYVFSRAMRLCACVSPVSSIGTTLRLNQQQGGHGIDPRKGEFNRFFRWNVSIIGGDQRNAKYQEGDGKGPEHNREFSFLLRGDGWRKHHPAAAAIKFKTSNPKTRLIHSTQL